MYYTLNSKSLVWLLIEKYTTARVQVLRIKHTICKAHRTWNEKRDKSSGCKSLDELQGACLKSVTYMDNRQCAWLFSPLLSSKTTFRILIFIILNNWLVSLFFIYNISNFLLCFTNKASFPLILTQIIKFLK